MNISENSELPARKPTSADYGWHKHYCRQCTEEFVTPKPEPVINIGGYRNRGNLVDSAHKLALFHHIRVHDSTTRYARCSRFCELREQHEEAASGQRIYGPGVQKQAAMPLTFDPFPQAEND